MAVPPEIVASLKDFGIPLVALMFLIVLVLIWSLIWKGLALWKSARLNQPIWFVILLIVNTMGILEILYIFILSPTIKRKQKIPVKNILVKKKAAKKK